MKKNILISSLAMSLALVSCKKNDNKMTSESYSSETTVTDENGKIDSVTTTSMEKTVDGQKSGSYSYPYKASDGSRAKATFTNGKSKTVLIEANNNKFQLDFKEKTSAGERYERSGISAETKGDSLIITQDNNVISLVRVK